VLKEISIALWYNKEKYDNILDDPSSNIWSFFDKFLLCLVLLFPLVLIFESVWNNSITYVMELLYFDAFISSAFLLEYIYRFYKNSNKFHFVITPIRIIDLLSFLPFFLWLYAVWDFLKILRLLRIFKILRLVKRIPMTKSFINSLKDYSYEYMAVFTLYLIVLFIGSFFVYYIEKDVIWTQFTSIWTSLWWGLVTMTTVWYWDMVPISSLWKIAWSILVFLWPVMWALTWAITIMVFMETSRNEMQKKHIRWKECNRCKTKNPLEANYCLKCWEEYSLTHHWKIKWWVRL